MTPPGLDTSSAQFAQCKYLDNCYPTPKQPKHQQNFAAKIKTSKNMLHEVCGSTWRYSAEILRISPVNLAFSAAEYVAQTNKTE